MFFFFVNESTLKKIKILKKKEQLINTDHEEYYQIIGQKGLLLQALFLIINTLRLFFV